MMALGTRQRLKFPRTRAYPSSQTAPIAITNSSASYVRLHNAEYFGDLVDAVAIVDTRHEGRPRVRRRGKEAMHSGRSSRTHVTRRDYGPRFGQKNLLAV